MDRSSKCSSRIMLLEVNESRHCCDKKLSIADGTMTLYIMVVVAACFSPMAGLLVRKPIASVDEVRRAGRSQRSGWSPTQRVSHPSYNSCRPRRENRLSRVDQLWAWREASKTPNIHHTSFPTYFLEALMSAPATGWLRLDLLKRCPHDTGVTREIKRCDRTVGTTVDQT